MSKVSDTPLLDIQLKNFVRLIPESSPGFCFCSGRERLPKGTAEDRPDTHLRRSHRTCNACSIPEYSPALSPLVSGLLPEPTSRTLEEASTPERESVCCKHQALLLSPFFCSTCQQAFSTLFLLLPPLPGEAAERRRPRWLASLK